MKITGAEFQEWYDNHWPGDDWYHDDFREDLFDDDGNLVEVDAVYDGRELGNICFLGPIGGKWKHHEFYSVESAILKWRKERDTFTIVVSGKKEQREELAADLKRRGFTVK